MRRQHCGLRNVRIWRCDNGNISEFLANFAFQMHIQKTNIVEPYASDIKEALSVLRKGGIILYPTDTVWGIGCDATNQEAVARIYALKQRVESKSMIVLMGNESQIYSYVEDPEDIAFELIEASDRPVTIIFDQAKGLAKNIIAADGSVGIRVTREKFSNALVCGLRRPLVSTSANISGQPSPSVYSEIDPEILAGVDYVCHYRRDDMSRHKPSAVIKISRGGVFKVLRQ